MSMALALNDLAAKFNSDKGRVFIGNRAANQYMDLYAEYFARHGFDENSDIKILEIGTNTGASLRIWAEFFKNAEVHGLDITREYELPHNLEHPNITTAIVDCGDAAALAAHVGDTKYDIIIDDGSHEQTHQQVALGVLFKNLNPGGLFVVEDLITGENWWDSNLYNKGRIKPTREVLQEFEKTLTIDSSVMTPEQIAHINAERKYCEYRESNAVIYTHHHPQIAFIGKV